jgi:hypothetical protein
MLPAYLGLYVKIVASSIDRFFLTKVFLIKTIAYRISIVSPFLLNACRIVRQKFQPPFIGKNVEYQNFSDTHVKKYARERNLMALIDLRLMIYSVSQFQT